VDVIIGALAQAIPERAVGAANGANTTAVFYGKKPETDEYYVYLETYGGGFGGRAHKDGKDGVQVHITNTSNLPIEALESEYPLFVETYCLIPDSDGAGEYRGGLGLRRDIRIQDHTCSFAAQGERFVLPPWGLFEGRPGATGKLVLHPDTEREKILPSKISDVEIRTGEVISIQTPGGGGYGDPRERDTKLIRKDLREGKITPQKAKGDYGVKIQS
jgi:N-methylhydantoinase B